jgi:hypothetical protein
LVILFFIVNIYGGVKEGYPIANKRTAVELPDDVIDNAVHEFPPGSVRSWISYHNAIDQIPCMGGGREWNV